MHKMEQHLNLREKNSNLLKITKYVRSYTNTTKFLRRRMEEDHMFSGNIL